MISKEFSCNSVFEVNKDLSFGSARLWNTPAISSGCFDRIFTAASGSASASSMNSLCSSVKSVSSESWPACLSLINYSRELIFNLLILS